jgi:thiamine-monophosphate kinase
VLEEKGKMAKKLYEIGEKKIIESIQSILKPSSLLLDGFGNDSSFIDIKLDKDEVFVVNTDRSGENIAYQFGLTNAEAIGDLGVSHAISDIIVAGGVPKFISVALLIPDDKNVKFVQQVMKGVQKASKRYEVILTGGDTKKNPKFAIIVTAVGIAKKQNRLTRKHAKVGDYLVISNNLGTMLIGSIIFKNNISISKQERTIFEKAIKYQRPPFKLGRIISKNKIANSSTDISDGLIGAISNILKYNNLGAIIDENKLPINKTVKKIGKHKLGIRPIQMVLAGGDWQFLYAIPKENIKKAKKLARKVGSKLSIVGKITRNQGLFLKTKNKIKKLNIIENDSFKKFSGKGYFESLEQPLNNLFKKD